jgi:hypothetical protein
MLLQYDGLDTIGDEDDDYKNEEGPEYEQGSDLDSVAAIGVEVDDNDEVEEDETEIQVGYCEKRSRLWVHHKYSLQNGLIQWMKTADECRMDYRAGPHGCIGPWTMN